MFILGVDLGQVNDYSAIAIVEQRFATESMVYHLRHLERVPLGTRYTEVVARVLDLLRRTPPAEAGPWLVADKTGVGASVCDLFLAAGVPPHAMTITGGDVVQKDDVYDLRVPKRELAGVLVSLYQGQRIKMAQGLEWGPALQQELSTFRVKININTGHDSYEGWRERDKDDLVLALAIAVWFAEHFDLSPFRYAAGSTFSLPAGYRLEG
jgi:hypothetical protein